MQGYDREKAVAFINGKLDTSEFKSLATQSEELTRQAIDLDFQYMYKAGVLNADGLMGDAYYDDDDAFEFLLDEMSKTCKLSKKNVGPLAAFVEQYMDLQQQFLEDSGMLSWD